jgi:Tol biopolymer transport system component
VIAELTEDHKQLVFKAFDVMKGEGSELLRVDYREGTFAWDLSLDGNRIAFREKSGEPIRIFSLRDQVMQEVHIKGLSNTRQLDWAADGKGFFTSNSVQGGADLYYVDLQGDAHVLWKQRGGQFTYARPSPDGRHLAMMDWTMSGNIWMMENF